MNYILRIFHALILTTMDDAYRQIDNTRVLPLSRYQAYKSNDDSAQSISTTIRIEYSLGQCIPSATPTVATPYMRHLGFVEGPSVGSWEFQMRRQWHEGNVRLLRGCFETRRGGCLAFLFSFFPSLCNQAVRGNHARVRPGSISQWGLVGRPVVLAFGYNNELPSLQISAH